MTDQRASPQSDHVQSGNAPVRQSISDRDFRALYDAHFGYAWRILQRLGVWDRDLEDAVHEVFIVVHRRYGDFDPTRPFKPWLAGIATRVASDFRRRAQHRKEKLEESDKPVDLEDVKTQGADEVLAQKQRRALIAQGLNGVPESQRVVFVLHELEGLSIPEISEIIDAPVNTLYSRLRLARKEFKAAILRASSEVQPYAKVSHG